MSDQDPTITPDVDLDGLAAHYRRVRHDSEALLTPASPQDGHLAAPGHPAPAWHLGHSTWFLETYLLDPFAPGPGIGHPLYQSLFAHPEDAPLLRPDWDTLLAYRHRVDQALLHLLHEESERHPQIPDLLQAALEHELQHQERLLEDLLALYATSPFLPVHREPPAVLARPSPTPPPLRWLEHPGGELTLGHDDPALRHRREHPRHRRPHPPFALASRLITNGEYLAFMEDGGYRRPELWSAPGWRARSAGDWRAPGYWRRIDGKWWQFGLHGLRPLDPHAPVAHLSHYEAEAYARWAGARLPDEAEWETLAQAHRQAPVQGRDQGVFQALPAASPDDTQFLGTLWEWTRSPLAPYPGQRPPPMAVHGYDDRLPAGHMVLRGGACITPGQRLRPTLREHAAPHCRHRFTGLRLARDLD